MHRRGRADSVTTPLLQRLCGELREDGCMPLSEFMARCLTDAEHGYYTTHSADRVFGKGGDFVTSPEISQVFGELMGVWAALQWRRMGCPPTVRLVEMGPGRGSLAADLVRAVAGWRRHDALQNVGSGSSAADKGSLFRGLESAMSLHLVEVSPSLRRAQREKLQVRRYGAQSGDQADVDPLNEVWETHFTVYDEDRDETITDTGSLVYWHERLEDVHGDGALLLIAHELLDALPVAQLLRAQHGWRQLVVDLDLEAQQAASAEVEPPHLPTPAAMSATSLMQPTRSGPLWLRAEDQPSELASAMDAAEREAALEQPGPAGRPRLVAPVRHLLGLDRSEETFAFPDMESLATGSGNLVLDFDVSAPGAGVTVHSAASAAEAEAEAEAKAQAETEAAVTAEQPPAAAVRQLRREATPVLRPLQRDTPVPPAPAAREEADGAAASKEVAEEAEAEAEAKAPLALPRMLGARLEASPESLRLVRSIGERLARQGGAALVIDYGEDHAQPSTLRGIREHEFVSFLSSPGEADVTADVDFQAVRAAAETVPGVKCSRTVTQNFLLQRLGLEERVRQILAWCEEEDEEKVIAAATRLAHPDQMGRLYKAVVMYSEAHLQHPQGPVAFEEGVEDPLMQVASEAPPRVSAVDK